MLNNLLFSIVIRHDFSVAKHDLDLVCNIIRAQADVIQNKLCLLSWCNYDLDIWVVLRIHDHPVPTCNV